VGINLGAEIYHGDGPDRPGVGWTPEYSHYPTQGDNCKIYRKWNTDKMSEAVSLLSSHPAGLKIDGKTAIWIANSPICYPADSCQSIWETWYPDTDCPAPYAVYSWGSVNEIQEVLQQVEQQTGEQIYVIMSGLAKDVYGDKFANVPQIGKITASENIILFWHLFGDDIQNTLRLNQSHRNQFEEAYDDSINLGLTKAESKFSLHVYPAFDERGLFPSDGSVTGSYLPRAVITRDGNGMYEANDGFLKASLDKAKANNLWVFLESWNDWNEQHQIEPGFHFNNFSQHQDYFSALRRIAEFKNIDSPNFFFPPLSALDPPIVESCRYQEFESKRVRLKGKFGFVQAATGSNGVALTVSYLDDDVSYRNPSYLPTQTWKNHVFSPKYYDGQLQAFDIDITPLLDKPGLVFGIESLGNPEFDMVFFPEFILDWYGTEVDLLDPNLLSYFNWHSQAQSLGWPNEDHLGVATWRSDVVLEDGQAYPKELYLNPNWNVGGDTFIHAGVDWMNIQSFLPQCVLPTNPPPSLPATPTPALTDTPTPTSTDQPTPTPTSVPTIPPSPTPTDLPTPTPTDTPIPTDTPTPTLTSAPPSSPTPTETPPEPTSTETPSPTPVPTPDPACRADVDQSGQVDAGDMNQVIADWGEPPSVTENDMNLDWKVNSLDLDWIISGWGVACMLP
jgi:hypothetical protein